MSKFRVATILMSATLVLGACANLDPTEKRVVYGAGAGAATGAVLGGVTGGGVVGGAVLGGALGAGGGYLYDQHKKGKL